MADFKSGSGPIVKGLSKTESPSDGKSMMGDMLSKIAGKMPTPRMSSGDKVAQAIQLLREAAQEDLRIAPLVNGAIQSLVTGGGPGGGPGQPPAPVQGPVAQAAGSAPGAMAAIAQMMGGGAAA